MRTRKKDKRNLVKVGAFLSGLTAVLMFMVMSIGNENSVFAPKVYIRAQVENVSNLKTGSYVELKGIRVGAVTDIRIISDELVEITAKILRSELKWIRQDSKVEINNAGLVGDKYLDILTGSKESPEFNPEKDILTPSNATGLKKLMEKGESIATVTDRILKRVDNVLEKLENGEKIAEGMNSLSKTAQNLESITKELKDAKIGVMAKNVSSSMERMDRILGRVEHGPGTMNSMLYDDALHDDLRALLGGAQRNKVIKYFIRESIKNSEKKQD